MVEALKAGQGSLFVQDTPGKAPEYVACLDLDPITEPAGDSTPIQCRQPDGSFKTVGSVRGIPGAVTTSIKALTFADSDALDRIKRCPVNVFVTQDPCGKLGVFYNYKRGYAIGNAIVTSRAWENLVKREGDDATIRTLDISGDNPVIQYRELKVSRQDIAETTDLNDIAACNVERCAGDCGAAKAAGQDLFTGGDSPAGSPTSTADIWATEDAGVVWANITGGAAHPFPAGVDIMSLVCFDIDRNTVRWLAAAEAQVGVPLHVAYSDDEGATWTQVHVGSTNNEGAADQGALKALDESHIWICTTAGNVYFSDDQGLTWILQDSSTASGGTQLNHIDFADVNNGWAVGNSNVVIQTTDGGDTWDAVAGPADIGDNLLSLHVFTRYRVIVGTNDDGLWQTWDEGGVWEDKNFTDKSTNGSIHDIEFINHLVGFMIRDSAAPVGRVHRSVDGGHSWQALDTPTNAGLNALAVINENLAHAVGNASGGTAVELIISG